MNTQIFKTCIGFLLVLAAFSMLLANVLTRVSAENGVEIRNAVVAISGSTPTQPISLRTGTFGYFRFDELEAGQTYVVKVNAKRFWFVNPSRLIALNDTVSDVDFIAEP